MRWSGSSGPLKFWHNFVKPIINAGEGPDPPCRSHSRLESVSRCPGCPAAAGFLPVAISRNLLDLKRLLRKLAFSGRPGNVWGPTGINPLRQQASGLIENVSIDTLNGLLSSVSPPLCSRFVVYTVFSNHSETSPRRLTTLRDLLH